jgi:hypothetical protein
MHEFFKFHLRFFLCTKTYRKNLNTYFSKKLYSTCEKTCQCKKKKKKLVKTYFLVRLCLFSRIQFPEKYVLIILIVTFFKKNNLWNVNYYYFNFFIFHFLYFLDLISIILIIIYFIWNNLWNYIFFQFHSHLTF